MKNSLKNLKGFTLVDVMMGITLTSVLVFLLGSFMTDIARYKRFVSQHQQLRTEIYSLAQYTLPEMIREAAAIDYANTSEKSLGVFMDKRETESWHLYVQDDPEGGRQLVVDQAGRILPLHSEGVVLEAFEVQVPPDPALGNLADLPSQRALQPLVRFRIQARTRLPEGLENRPGKGFFDEPRMAYESAVTLRNYGFSNLYHVPL